MKVGIIFLFALTAFRASSKESYLQLSKDGKNWTNPAQSLCMSKLAEGSSSEYRIDLNLGVGPQKRTIASYFLNLLPSGGDSQIFGPSVSDATIFDEVVTIGFSDDEVLIGSQMFYSKHLTWR